MVALLAGIGLLGAVTAAQEERPQITPGERKVPRKKGEGPRALAVLRVASNGKASLAPIAILINGKFYDATAYKGNPVPMALESGTVYEGFHTGSSAGLFTVNSALRSNAANADTPWIGTGVWLPSGADTGKSGLKAEAVPVGLDTSDERPRLTKTPAAPKVDAPASATPPASAPTAATPPSGKSDSGDEPPRLTSGKAAPTSEPAAPAGSSGPAGDSKAGDSKPGDAKVADAKPSGPKPPASDSGADDAHRPRLRRGVQNQPLPEEEVPGYSKPGAASKAATSSVADAAKTTSQGPLQIVPAISDAVVAQAKSYKFEWLKDEEGERRTQMTTLAKQQLRAYLDAQAKAKIAPAPPAKTSGATAARSAGRKGPEPIFANAQMIAYDLWGNNQPILIFSAEAHMPPAPASGGQGASALDTQYSIMLVARTDIYSNLHTLYSGVTDRYHLDITPRLELIDAVDADGDGYGELLFRKTSDGSSGWVVYRATNDKLWKMFDSLNPE